MGQNQYGADADGYEYWRHLANTIESSVCCGDAALCQIIFDHLLYFLRSYFF